MSATDTRRARLQAALDAIADDRRAGVAPAVTIERMKRDHDARHACYAWTNLLRIAGTTATCTWSEDKGLLEAWVRLATLHVLKLDGRAE